MKKLPKDYPKLVIDHHVHDNRMVFGIICCCFVCFMFVGFAFMEKGGRRHFVYLDLESELAGLFVLVFSLHEDCGNLALIGALDYGRMKRYGHKKDGIFLQSGHLFEDFLGDVEGAKCPKAWTCCSRG
jgi:hypothetical protein